MTLMEQNVLPAPVSETDEPPEGRVFPALSLPDWNDPLLSLVRSGWDDRSLLEDLRTRLQRGPGEACGRSAYQAAKTVVQRDSVDEEASDILLVALELLGLVGWRTEAQLIATRISGLKGATAPLRLEAARLLHEGGSVRSALALAETLEGAEALALTARCRLLVEDPAGAFEAALEATRAAPARKDLIPLLAETAMAAGHAEAALNAIRGVPKVERSRDLLLLEAGAREQIGDAQGSARALRILLERDPTQGAVRDRLIRLFSASGEAAAARDLYRAGLELSAARLPASAEELFEEPSRFGFGEEIPDERIAWLGQVTGHRVDGWQAHELLAFDNALLAWAQTRPERLRDLTYRVRLSEEAQGLLMDLHLSGRGVLIAAGHLGLLNGGLIGLLASGFRFGFTGPALTFDLPHLSPHLVPTRAGLVLVRDLIARVRAGEAVAMTVDAAPGSAGQVVRFFDREIRVSDLCARFSARLDIPSVFPRVLPAEGGVISVDLRRLPSWAPGLSREAFLADWARAWAAEAEDLMRTAPWALRGAGGFWDA